MLLLLLLLMMLLLLFVVVVVVVVVVNVVSFLRAYFREAIENGQIFFQTDFSIEASYVI